MKEKPIDTRFPATFSFINGFWFERLISFMDFMPAAMALIDDEQTDAIKDLFAEMTDLGCRVIDKLCQYMPALDLIEIHDDWGAQKAPFFSMDVAYELFVPFMKQITDHIHAKGRRALLHSCGHNADRIQCYIDGGFDLWQPQAMNDIGYLYDRWPAPSWTASASPASPPSPAWWPSAARPRPSTTRFTSTAARSISRSKPHNHVAAPSCQGAALDFTGAVRYDFIN